MSLTPSEWERVAAEFDRLFVAPAEIRRAAVAELAVEHPALASELEALLLAADRTDTLLDHAAMDVHAAMEASVPALIGRRLGAYLVTRVIGRGGMGIVFEGQHTDAQLAKRVAIKTLSIGVERPERLWRFRRERQILAALDHPNIAALYDGGTTDDGVPYLIMEYVSGERLDAWCEARRLPIEARLDLFRQVCGAVHFAHTKLVVHRDLKPSNILVTDAGVVKLLDFGIAKLLSPDDERDETTRGGIAPLTTAYASPEQARGEEITTAADVYSLGIVLYRLLTGNAPYDIDGRSAAEVLRILSTQEPRTPSAGITDEHARSCGASDARPLRATVSGELDAIVLMALRKEPARRYPSVDALSADLLRYLRGQPVQARPDTLWYRARKFVARERTLVAGIAIAVLAMLGGTIASLRSASIARDEARRAQRMSQYLQAVVGAADPSHYSTFRTGSTGITIEEVLDSTRSRVATDLGDDPRLRADLYWTLGGSYRTFSRYDVAAMLFDSARVLHTMTRGAQSIEVTRDIHFRGLIDQETGKADSAASRFGQALTRYRQMRAPPDTEVIDVLGSLGQSLSVQMSRPDSAVPLLRQATALERARARPRWHFLGIAESALGSALMQTFDTSASDSAHARAIAALTRDSVRSSGDLGLSLVNWGTSLGRRGLHERAVPLQRAGLARIAASLGPRHYITATGQSRLANELLQLGRIAEAKALTDSSIATLTSLVPMSASEVCYSLRVHAAVELAAGDRDGAKRTLARAWALIGQTGSSRPPLEANLLLVAADVHLADGDRAAAQLKFERADSLATAALGPNHATSRLAASRLVAFRAQR